MTAGMVRRGGGGGVGDGSAGFRGVFKKNDERKGREYQELQGTTASIWFLS